MGYQGNERSFQLAEVRFDAFGQIGKHLVGDDHAFAESAGTQHGQARMEIRTLQFHGQSPFEAGEQALLEILQVHRGAVRCKDQLAAILLQVVEDVEHRILRPLALQALDIIHDEHVDLHIECQEIREFVAHEHGIHVLGLELAARHIEDNQLGIFLLNGVSDSLGDVCLAQSRSAKDKQRIESGFTRSAGDGLPCRDTQFVTRPAHQVVETVFRFQPRVYLDALRTRVHKRTRIAGGLIGVDGHLAVHGRHTVRCREFHGRLLADHLYLIDQTGIGTNHAFERFADDVQISLLEPLAEELGRYLNRERRALERHGPDRLEPCRKFLRLDDLFDEPQAIVPNVDMSFRQIHR